MERPLRGTSNLLSTFSETIPEKKQPMPVPTAAAVSTKPVSRSLMPKFLLQYTSNVIWIIPAISQKTDRARITRFRPRYFLACPMLCTMNSIGRMVLSFSSGGVSFALMDRELTHPPAAIAMKVRESPQAGTLWAKKEAIMVPVIMPRKETISMFPVPKVMFSWPPISRINPYLEGEKRELCTPISRMETITSVTL